jgi:hypothetical protein
LCVFVLSAAMMFARTLHAQGVPHRACDAQPGGAAPQAPRGEIGAYEATVAGIRMWIWTPPEEVLESGPTQLFVYFHGDEAHDFYRVADTARVRRAVLAQGLIYVSMLAPNGRSWWTGGDTSSAVRSALDWLAARYDVLPSETIVHGVSGGATGLTSYLLPGGLDAYVSAALLACGGSARGNMRAWQPDGEVVSRLRVWMTYGDRDFLADPRGPYGAVIPAAIEALRARGIEPNVRVIPGATHCAFDQSAWVLQTLPALIAPRPAAPAAASTSER